MLCFLLLLRQTFQDQIDAKVRFVEDACLLEQLNKEDDDDYEVFWTPPQAILHRESDAVNDSNAHLEQHSYFYYQRELTRAGLGSEFAKFNCIAQLTMIFQPAGSLELVQTSKSAMRLKVRACAVGIVYLFVGKRITSPSKTELARHMISMQTTLFRSSSN